MSSPGWLFARGVVVGLLIAAPIGPMALLSIRRTLARGWTSGIACGLGIATADAVYASVAVFGLTAISSVVIGHGRQVQALGSAAIMVIGLRTLLAPAAAAPAPVAARGLARDYLSCVALTLSNPPTILLFAAILAGTGFGTTAGGWRALLVVAGVATGSAGWWAGLALAVDRLRERFSDRVRRVLTRVAGATLSAIGLTMLAVALLGR